jgi:ABC-type glycerol-3-phosphate transport system substrate-binding protein
MGKYIKAIVLLLLAAAPVVIILMLTAGVEDISAPYYNGYNAADRRDIDDSDIEQEIEIININQPQVTTLTLARAWMTHDMMREVLQFNRENEYYQIEVIATVHDIQQDVDIILSDILLNKLPMADLYTFIDADPEMNRSDFFPNALSALEAPDGTLPSITHGFVVETMISLREIAEQITPLAYKNLLRQLENPDSSEYSVFDTTWETIIFAALRISGHYFLDFERGTANFLSDEFITILQLAARMPERITALDRESSQFMQIRKKELESFRSGNMLLYPFVMSTPEQFLIYQAALGDIVPVGVPTVTGGRHIIRHGVGIGINADSPHQEAAWSFVRRFLLPSFEVNVQAEMPLRIDLFESRIAELMIPDIQGGVEKPIIQLLPPFLNPNIVNVYAMTEYQAAVIRNLAESASYHTLEFTGARWESIVWDETRIFIRGERSAEETARIIQDRVQEYLDGR